MSCARDYIYYRYLVALTIKSCSALRGTGDSLHDDGSSCDRYHAGKRNVVILPIAEITSWPTTRTHSGPKGANTSAEHWPFLARFLPLSVYLAERHLLDNVCWVYLDHGIANLHGSINTSIALIFRKMNSARGEKQIARHYSLLIF